MTMLCCTGACRRVAMHSRSSVTNAIMQSSSFFKIPERNGSFIEGYLTCLWTENIYQKSVLRFLRTMVKFSNWLFGFLQGVVSFKTMRPSGYQLPFLIATQHWKRDPTPLASYFHTPAFEGIRAFHNFVNLWRSWQRPTTWTTPITICQHITQSSSLFQHCAYECCWPDPLVISLSPLP
jgi:hypothetical protein